MDLNLDLNPNWGNTKKLPSFAIYSIFKPIRFERIL